MDKEVNWEKRFGAEMTVYSEVVAEGKWGWMMRRSVSGNFEVLGWNVLDGILTPLLDATKSFFCSLYDDVAGRPLFLLSARRKGQ